MTEESDRELSEYVVEIAVHGTWRETVVAYGEEEAEDILLQEITNRLTQEEMNWGDLGMEAVGTREIEES